MRIYAYLAHLNGPREAVTPCGPDEYTVYIEQDLTREEQQKGYDHAVWHIEQGDFEAGDVQQIEALAHNRGG